MLLSRRFGGGYPTLNGGLLVTKQWTLIISIFSTFLGIGGHNAKKEVGILVSETNKRL
jgi:hypothetical protein